MNLSTPSLGITSLSVSLNDVALTDFQLPLSGSLDIRADDGPGSPTGAFFQLPLSGSLRGVGGEVHLRRL